MVADAVKGGTGAVRWCLAAAVLLLLENAFAACPTLDPDITHRTSVSYCELCGVGEVTIRFTYPGNNNPDLTNIVITEDLGSSGLTYVAGTTSFDVNNGAAPAPFEPTVSGPNGSVLTWDLGSYVLPAATGGGQGNAQFLEVTFQVRRADDTDQEALVTADRTVIADISYATTNEPNNFEPCSDTRTSGPQTLPLREPLPEVVKLGRNVDAEQDPGQYANPLYGHSNDDVIWRIEFRNGGLVGLQDLRFDDLMQGTDNLVINYACPTEADADAIAQNDGADPGGTDCVAAGNTIDDFVVTDPFGDMGTSDYPTYPTLSGFEIDVEAGGSAPVYLVGKITANGSCVGSRANTVDDVQWGCEIEPPAGGISATSTGSVPAATATLITRFGDQAAELTVDRQLTGTNTAQPVGTKGTMTITITNNTGGTVKNIALRDVLPPEYVVDSTFPPTASMDPAYNPYPGMIDTLTWTNPEPGTFPLTTMDPAFPLGNVAPEFTLTSTGPGCPNGPCATDAVHPDYADQRDMMRHGDVLTIQFRVVLIRSDSYDRVADVDVRTESPAENGTDPTHVTTLANTLTVEHDMLCAAQGHVTRDLTGNGTAETGDPIPADPEDIDVDIVGNELIFILTNDPDTPLPLTVELRNNGGHTAADYAAYVSFGATMEVVTAPAGCAVTTNPPPLPPWRLPAPIPGDATVYECTDAGIGTLAPGQTRLLDFEVIKTDDPDRIAADDLTFRADVIGEITLSDGTPLWFPEPIARADGVTDRANNYTLDAIRARVIGFNLLKSQLGTCTENNPPPGTPDDQVQIGEECSVHIETGGWFGFQTPGFTYIAVQRIQVVDELPDGQGYISSTDPLAESTSAIQGVSLNPPGLEPLDEGWIDWTFNQVVPDQRITERDHWFRVDVTTRLLNDPIDTRAAPNQHAALSRDILNSTFEAVFFNENTNEEEVYLLGQNTVGYPPQAVRQVDLTVTEPQLAVTKEVCNETLYGTGPACSNWTDLADDGDAFHSYIYRITVENEDQASGVTRAPAYDVIVTDTLDASDLAFVLPFDADGLDNDADASTDEAGAEGAISDNVVKNGTPAEITFSYTHSSALERIDPGQSVELYYRVDFDDDAAPEQTFTNSASATYDSLEGPTGNQSAPQRPNGDIGGARVYQSPADEAAVRIIPVLTRPKTITRLANTPLAGASPQPVSIGEEIEYELVTSLPVALLRDFVIRDELPAGIRCAEAPDVDLGPTGPHAEAGFEPGGVITPTCTDTLVEWNFGDQRVTNGPDGNRYDFAIRFIARVENTAGTNDGDVIANGGAATRVTASYVDEGGNTVELAFGQVDVVVREPRIELTKSFAVAGADAGDVLTVTVTATNTGTATAYDLRVLDDLTGSNLTALGSVGGTDPPDNVDTTTLGPDRPIFSWDPANPKYAIAPGETRSFTFDLSVDTAAQPLEILDNEIQARWTSLPDRSTALNSGGEIGPDGSETGLRNGALPNAGDPVNDYETSASASLTVPALSMSKTDLAPATVPTIGAHKHFRIEIRLPEGTTQNLSATDDLAAAGLSYVLANNADFDITYGFEGIASINGQAPDEAAFNAFPADGTSGSATWDIGTVVTETENDTASSAIDPVIRIDYYARVNNDLDTDAGDTLQNGVTASYTHGETGAPETVSDAAPAVTVVEPRLTLSKTVANVTPGKQPDDQPVAGDVLEYQIIAANTGDATAFDINIVDDLPPGVELDPNFTPTATIDGAPVSGFVAQPAGAPAGPLNWGRENGDDSLDVPAGQTLTLTYHAVVQVVADPDGLIENAALADWTSLDDVSPYERTGDGCPNITPPDDYCAGPAVASTTGIKPVLEFRKTVINATTGEDPGSTATPGDVLRYRVQVRNVSAAPVSDFSLVDDLDALNDPAVFVPGTLTLITVPAGADASNTDPNGGVRGTGLVDIRGLSVGVAGDPDDTVVVEFEVQLEPVIPDATVVLNQAQLQAAGLPPGLSDDPNVNGPDDPAVAGDEDPTRTVIESAPAFRVEKTSEDLTGDPTVLFAGDTLRYTITVKNVGTEDAVDVTLSDSIPANTTYVPGSTTLNGTAVPDPAAGTSPLESGMLINAPEDPTPGAMRADATDTPDNVATVTFDVVVDPGVPNGTEISNQGFVNGTGTNSGAFPEQPSDDPATADPDDPTIDVVTGLEFQKSVFNVTTGADGATASPGDTLRYRLEVTNNGAVPLNDFTVIDEIQELQPASPLFFEPGTLTLVSVPPGADTSNTDPNGGASGAGIVDVRGLSVSAGGTVAIEFTIQLAPVIANGTEVLNQAELRVADVSVRRSDDDDPGLTGDEDPTPTVIASAPAFRVEKTSQDLTDDPNVLMAGDTLRYTITIKNVGTENAVDVALRDPIPANTAYVPGSTTLNGAAVPDAGGTSPLQDGMLVNAPEDPTPGAMRADATDTPDNVATVTFDVVVDPDAVDGTIISNQGFVTGAGTNSGPFPEQPSDDPATPTPDDPTRDIVGNLPLVYAHKTVEIQVDGGSPGIVDPGDVLRYTITITNSGATPATGVVLTDPVPADTTYVADSVVLNGLPVGQPDGGVSPLIAGIDVSSSDLTPPLPGPGAGTLSPGGTAVVTFDVQVDAGVPEGTIISNQGSVATNELPTQLTDADGVPANGFQPTEVVVGDAQQLTITKEVFVVGGGAAEAGGQLEYVVRVTNISTVPATNVVITDDLSPIGPDPYVPGSGTLNGLADGISYTAPVLTADYAAVYGDLPPGETAVLRFRVNIPPDAPTGATITNTAVVTWNDPAESASASASVDIGGVPGSAILNGRVWHDADFDNALGSAETPLAGWLVELYRGGTLLGTATTDGAGAYRFSGLAPSDTSDPYELRFHAPGAGPDTALLGEADSPFTDDLQRISDIVAGSGSNLQDLNLPIDPNGVVYDSVARTPIAGVTLTLLRAATSAPLPGSCFEDPGQQGQVTLASGYFKFDLNFSDPACPAGADYLIEVAAPPAYGAAPSQIIPPATSGATPAYSVPVCPDDAVPATDHCEAQSSELAPGTGVPARSVGTRYYLHVTLSDGQVPQDSQLFNNHIPIDPELEAAVLITKTSPLINVTRGQLVPYTITVRNTLGGTLPDLTVVDTLPPGFKYVAGSGRFDGNPDEPADDGRRLRWENVTLVPAEQHTLKLLLIAGAGVSEGEYVNRAQVVDAFTGGSVSGVATATVRVVPDPTFDCTDVIGRVYDDANLNGYPDEGEAGIGGARVVSARGLIARTDRHGRFHITCAAVPNPDRGGNFILKLDDRSLPAGYRVTTENPRVLRATRGKAIKFNFGAALHRVVRLDVADGVFEPDSAEVRPQWEPRFGLLLEELRKEPSMLRISYLADVEDAGLVRARLAAIRKEVAARWAELECCDALSIETEIYWRRGGPPDRRRIGK